MKLSRIFTVFGIVALFSLASCKKDTCYVCTDDAGVDASVTLCEEDYPSVLGVSTFQPAIDAQESLGFTCTKQ